MTRKWSKRTSDKPRFLLLFGPAKLLNPYQLPYSLERQLQSERELRMELQGPIDSQSALAAAAVLEVKELKAEVEDVYSRVRLS